LYHAASASAFSALAAVGITATAWGTLIVVGVSVALGGLDITVALTLGQLCLLVVPVIAMRIGGRTVAALGIARAPWQYAIAALLVGSSAWYINIWIVSLIQINTEIAVFKQLLDELPLLATLASIALAPAICEEVLFRGVLLRGLATRFHPPAAIGLSALAFAAYHMNFVQLIPTFTLGCVLGLIALRAASSLPAMLAHFVNNTIALLMSRGDLPMLSNRDSTGWFDRHPTLTLAGATALTTTGIAIAMIAPKATMPRTV
jgi:membrane protease YdiL (CAAX protease family)